jgi:TolB-like protein/Tfp pilus assembly protein PilF
LKILKELQRRNVFRVSIGYLISAWLLSQVADFVLDLIGAPNWVLQSIVLLLALGFPVVAFFAWAYEVTPEGIKRESEVNRDESITNVTGKKLDRAITVVLILALGYFIWESRFAPDPPAEVAEAVSPAVETEAEPAAQDEAEAPDRKSIAVLPFDNRSNREEDQFFTDGIHDDLLTTIAKIGSMKVISRTSVMEYRGTTKKIPEIAAELGVANVLEGGIQRSGNQVRINVQLIDAETDEHLWAEIFDRELTAENLFAIQSEISNMIAEALEAALTPEEQQRIDAMPTSNLEAYEAYLRGRQLMATRRIADLEQATKEFARAVELDPEFALAWVGVADSHDLLRNYTRAPIADSIELRKNAVEKALALDPGLGEAWVSQAQIYENLYQREEAEAAFKKGIELSPNYAQGCHWYGILVADDTLRTRDRLELAYRARELDPRSLIIGANLAGALLDHGQYSRGLQQIRDLIDLDPEFPNAYHMLLDHQLYRAGEYAEALVNARKLTELDPDNLDGLRHQAEIFIEIGDFETAIEIQDQISDLDPDHIFAAWPGLIMALTRGNAPAAQEAINWILPRAGDERWAINSAANTQLALGNTEKARALFLQADPSWLDPATWEWNIRDAPDTACTLAWLFLRTGDESLGMQLLEQASDFLDNRLPDAGGHVDRYDPEICYLAAGETDKALDSLETQLEHGHIFGWNGFLRSPVYDPIRHEPRLQAMLEERERLIAIQREAIEEMLAEDTSTGATL